MVVNWRDKEEDIMYIYICVLRKQKKGTRGEERVYVMWGMKMCSV